MKAIVKAPAKINLTLDIVGKRADGYHDVAMVMQTVSLYDTVTVETNGEKGEGIEVSCPAYPEVPTDDSNIVCKAAKAFFELFKKRLIRYFRELREPRDFSLFVADPIAIESLESLRNQIAYTNRNNYVIDPDQTPFSFPYGANAYYFNPFAKSMSGKKFGDMSDRAKMRLLHSKKIDYPGSFIVLDGMILPMSFCDIYLGERFFRDARHYMHKITRDVESYKELAELLGDLEYYTDDELVGIVYSICRKNYGQERPSLLSVNQRNELARTLHYEYKADNAKISRLLQLPRRVVDAMFPMSSKS